MQNQIQGFRLSPQQQQLWKLQQETAAPYQAVCTIDCAGPLDKDALQIALQHCVQQHEILRTNYKSKPGIVFPLQIVTDTDEVELTTVDLSDDPAHQQELEISSRIQQEQKRPLAEGEKALRTTLLKLAIEHHILLISLPSLNADAGTLINLFKDVAHNYDALGKGLPLSFDEETIQYLQFSEWQHDILENEEATPGKEFWRQHTAFSAAALSLPEEQAVEDEQQTFTMEYTNLPLTLDLASNVQRLQQHYEVSEEAVLFTCWQLLLWNLSNQNDIISGLTYDGRKYEELLDGYGLFTNTLPLHCTLEPYTHFSTLLKQTDGLITDARTWLEYFSPDQENKAIGERRAQVAFEKVDLPDPRVAGEVTFRLSTLMTWQEPAKIKLSCLKNDQGINLIFQYLSQHFSAESMQQLARRYLTLLKNVLAAPDEPIAQLEMLDASERQQLLIDFNRTAIPYPQDVCFQTLFEEQVVRTPENIAVEIQGQTLSYSELNRRANQLAHYLRKQQVGPDVLVALHLPRSLEAIIAVLGILKAGGAYVPFDPEHPIERLRFQLEDTNAPVIITCREFASSLPSLETTQMLFVDEMAETLSLEAEYNPVIQTQSANIVYVIYTSGSTGTPKGVMITHDALLNYLRWATQEYRMVEGIGTPVHSSLAFDMIVTSLLAPLIVGQRIIMLTEELGIGALGEMLKERKMLSLIKLTPSHLKILNRWLTPEDAADKTQALIIGGEALNSDTIAFWQQNAPRTRLINEYGPTEAVVGCCVYEVPIGKTFTHDIPIGFPIANTQLYVLDDYLKPVSLDTIGELHIGGAGLARGYLNQPALTAERFIPDPFSSEPGMRLYRTGDLASYQKDGVLQLHGRNDRQVKIHGFRIEPGEVESTLNQLPAVRESLVLPYQEPSGEQNQVAYIVSVNQQQRVQEDVLLHQAQATLPDYMIPTHFVVLPNLPLTSNGKVDTQALPEPDQQQHARADYAPPQTNTERELITIWQEVLKLEQIGIHDNFFDLGGNSFLLIEATSKIQEAKLGAMTLLDMFEHPTVNTQAQHIQQQQQPHDTLQQKSQDRARRQKAALGNRQQREAKQKEKTI